MVKRLAAFQIPQAPGRAVHHRFRKQGDHVKITGELCVHIAHGMGIVVVPTRQFREFLMLWRLVALNERIKEHPLAWRAIAPRRWARRAMW